MSWIEIANQSPSLFKSTIDLSFSRRVTIPRLKSSVFPIIYPERKGKQLDLYNSQEHAYNRKYKYLHPGFELWSLYPLPATLSVALRILPIMFGRGKIALSNGIKVLSVSVVVSVEINSKLYLWNVPCKWKKKNKCIYLLLLTS